MWATAVAGEMSGYPRRMESSEFRVECVGFRVQGPVLKRSVGFRVQGSGLCSAQSSGFMFQGSGFRNQGCVGFRVQGSGSNALYPEMSPDTLVQDFGPWP